MRRKDKMTSVENALRIVDACVYVSMATVNADGTPYNIPISIARKGDKLYFHCANEGKKTDNIRENPAVCLSCVKDAAVKPGHFSMTYASAVLTGKAHEVTDEAEKHEALRLICLKYTPDIMDRFEGEVQKYAGRTAVYGIDIEEITGKKDDRP